MHEVRLGRLGDQASAGRERPEQTGVVNWSADHAQHAAWTQSQLRGEAFARIPRRRGARHTASASKHSALELPLKIDEEGPANQVVLRLQWNLSDTILEALG